MLVLYSKAFLKATSASCKRPFCVKTLPKLPKAENKKKKLVQGIQTGLGCYATELVGHPVSCIM